MLIADAQREVRTSYLGGSVGQLVSALIWWISAAIATFLDPKTGFWTLAIGGGFVFPIIRAIFWISGRKSSIGPQNPLHYLGMQVAFTVPFVLPLAGAAAMNRLDWFYPACLVIVGTHYLPFVFLYGMKTFAFLAATLIAAGFGLVFLVPGPVAMGGWVGGAILFVFAFVLLAAFKIGESSTSVPG